MTNYSKSERREIDVLIQQGLPAHKITLEMSMRRIMRRFDENRRKS